MRYLILIAVALALAGCSTAATADWPWQNRARDVRAQDFNSDEIVEPCLTTAEKIKALREFFKDICPEGDPVEPEPASITPIAVPLEVSVAPAPEPEPETDGE